MTETLRTLGLATLGLAALPLIATPALAKDASKDFLRSAKRNDAAGMIAAAEKLAQSPSKKGVKVLVSVGAMIPNLDVYRACRNALGAAKTGKPRAELLKLLKKAHKMEQRVLCVDGLGASADPSAIPPLTEALEDKSKAVRMSAIRALNRIEHKDCVEPLFMRLSKVGFDGGDAEAEELYGVLHRLTGKAFENLDDWKKWWSVAKADFDPRKQRNQPEQSTRTRKTAGKIFESVVRSQDFVLVLDISSSMRVIDLPRGKTVKSPKTGNPITYKDPDPSGQKRPDKSSRFKKAQEAFIKLIGGLNSHAKFAVVVFASKKETQLYGGKPVLMPATASNKKKVIKWIEGLKWGPATRTDLALDLAFKVRGADSIYLFSDGIPEMLKSGKNKDIPVDEILKKARTLNRARKVKLHCYAITSNPSTQKFLRQLAAENGGEFKDIRAR